jgi:hypothetical protein
MPNLDLRQLLAVPA